MAILATGLTVLSGFALALEAAPAPAASAPSKEWSKEWSPALYRAVAIGFMEAGAWTSAYVLLDEGIRVVGPVPEIIGLRGVAAAQLGLESWRKSIGPIAIGQTGRLLRGARRDLEQGGFYFLAVHVKQILAVESILLSLPEKLDGYTSLYVPGPFGGQFGGVNVRGDSVDLSTARIILDLVEAEYAVSADNQITLFPRDGGITIAASREGFFALYQLLGPAGWEVKVFPKHLELRPKIGGDKG